MQKTTTSSKKTDLETLNVKLNKRTKMQPADSTLQNIMRFAASYRTQQIANNQFVEMFLN